MTYNDFKAEKARLMGKIDVKRVELSALRAERSFYSSLQSEDPETYYKYLDRLNDTSSDLFALEASLGALIATYAEEKEKERKEREEEANQADAKPPIDLFAFY